MRTILIGILAVAFSFISVNCSCKSVEPMGPEPIVELNTLIEKSVHQWLDVRVDSAQQWKVIFLDTLGAKDFHQLDDILWDHLGYRIMGLVNDIRSSELYIKDKVSDEQLFKLVGEALKTYSYEE